MSAATKDYPAFELKTGDGKAELELVPAFGGLINGLWLTDQNGNSHNVIAGLPSLERIEVNEQFRGVVLYPYPNRLDGGCYTFGGQEYQFEINETGLNNQLHGLLFALEATVSGSEEGLTESWVELRYAVDGSNPGYPFQADVRLRYTLNSETGLSVDYSVKNLHDSAVPVGLGWHPYLQIPGRSINDLTLQIPAVEHTPVDERMLPTGETKEYTEFQEAKVIGQTAFDDCYRLIERSSEGRARVVLSSPADGLGLEVWQDYGPEGCNFIQLCTPPDRQCIAIEPMSCGINAFNTGDGLLELQPGEEFHIQFGVKLV